MLQNVTAALDSRFGHVGRLHAPSAETHFRIMDTIGNNDGERVKALVCACGSDHVPLPLGGGGSAV